MRQPNPDSPPRLSGILGASSEGKSIRNTVLLAAGLTASALLASPVPSTAQQTIKPVGPAWTVKPPFEKNAEVGEAISGAGCVPISPPMCLAANDEKKYAQFFTMHDRRLAPGRLIRLVQDVENGVKFGELDLEGVAYAGGYFYLTGSHAPPRNLKKPIDASRFLLFRFKVNAQTGLPDFPFGDDTVDTKSIEKTSKLRAIIKQAPKLGASAEIRDPLTANIEGIAVSGEHVFLGFRAPVGPEGHAYVIRVNVDGMFGSQPIDAKELEVKLHAGGGIRDLASLKDGLLILSGPAPADVPGTYAVHHWDGQSKTARPLAVLGGVPAEGKPETILVLDGTSPAHYRVLILVESATDGHPLEYLVPRQ